jgi:hypothetical protein
MKKLSIVLAAVALFVFSNCTQKVDNSVKNTGTTIVLNGKGGSDTINYTCVNCEELLDKSSFEKIVTTSTEETKKLMKFPRTFISLKMEITVGKVDSILHYSTNEKFDGILRVITKYYYAAQNAYGTETEGDTYISFYADTLGNVKNIESLIKLSPLHIEGDGVDRKLIVYSDDGDYIKVNISKKDLLVTSSLSCVDKGAWLTFYLDNDEKFYLTSWNSFNCDGYSFFYWFNKSQIELLKSHKVKFIAVTDKKSVSCFLPENEQDYFMQLVNLYNK